MRTLIIFESMYGNTHAIAVAIAHGLKVDGEVSVIPVAEATSELMAQADLLIFGGPTHAHSLSSESTRRSALNAAVKSQEGLMLDPDTRVDGPGLRELLATIPQGAGRPAIAFDTRYDGPALLTGHASHGIADRLTKQGFFLVTEPESFLVDKHNRLVEGEVERATEWASRVTDLTIVLTAHTSTVHLNEEQANWVDSKAQ